jgi:excisionase family DNA binding protein
MQKIRHLTLSEVADRLRSSVRTIRSLIAAGELRAVPTGPRSSKRPRYVVREDDLERFEAERATAPAPRPVRRAAPNGLPNYFS